jgi:hypothetical protein
MSDTPETDNLARGNHVVPTEFAQDLERERNNARQIANEMSESNEVLLADLHYTRQDLKEARKALKDIAALDTSQDASPQQCAAVLLAMNALGK